MKKRNAMNRIMTLLTTLCLVAALAPRASAQVSPQRYQTPLPPFPYGSEEIAFVGSDGDIRISGTLTLPEGEGPFPAAILVSGAGGQDRDGTIMGHKPFLVIADYLTRRGIAVLRYDDRGIGRSSGDRTGATTEDYALDCLGAVRKLARHAMIDSLRIGIIGHSEGGTIASIAASRCSGVSFIVMLGSPGLPGREYNAQYEESTARAMGQSEATIRDRLDFQSSVLDIVLGEGEMDDKETRIREILYAKYEGLPEERIERAVKRFLSPWFIYNVSYDPHATLSTLRCAVLALYGEKDVQVPPEGNADAVLAALRAAGAGRFEVNTLEGLNHFFQTAPTGNPSEYGTIEETISPKVLEIIGDWISVLPIKSE